MKRFLLVLISVAMVAGGASRGVATVPGRVSGAASLDPALALVSSLDAREELLEAGGSKEAIAGASHNPANMFLLSLAVPGSGQLVQGHKRGYLFILAEIAFWGSFYVLDQKGLDERDGYERFADENWDYEAYMEWYEDNCVGCEDCGYECRPIAECGTQEYYEDIGKYATYWRWWNIDGDEDHIEWWEYSGADEAVRDEYWGARGDSNTHLRQARYFMMAAFLNHIVAAVDSYVSGKPRDVDAATPGYDLGIEFDVADRGDGLRCAFVARY